MATLGCGPWRAVLQCRGGGQLVEVPWQHLTMGRRVDDISAASVTVTSQGLSQLRQRAYDDCCGLLATLQPWEHELALWRGGEEVWVGPIQEPEFGHDAITIPARDLTAWWERRLLGRDRSFTDVDLATIFEQYHADAMQPDPSPNIHLVTTPTGVTGTRSIRADAYRRAADELRELARSGLDYTAYGRTVRAGGAVVPASDLGMLLTEHFNQPKLVVHGLLATTRAVVIGGRTSTGTPIVGEAGGGNDQLGLLEQVATESSILDAASCNAAAATRVDLLEAPDYMTGQLLAGAPVAFRDLVPGATADLRVAAMCRAAVGTYRLLALDVSADLDEQSRVTEVVTPTFTLPGTVAA